MNVLFIYVGEVCRGEFGRRLRPIMLTDMPLTIPDFQFLVPVNLILRESLLQVTTTSVVRPRELDQVVVSSLQHSLLLAILWLMCLADLMPNMTGFPHLPALSIAFSSQKV